MTDIITPRRPPAEWLPLTAEGIQDESLRELLEQYVDAVVSHFQKHARVNA